MNRWFDTKNLRARIIAIAVAGAFLLNASALVAQSDGTPATQPADKDAMAANSSSVQVVAMLPDSPSAAKAQANQSSTQTPSEQVPTQNSARIQGTTAPSPNQESSANNEAQQGSKEQQSSSSKQREPLGTAAAEAIPTTGVAASRPAGAAMAPAKQRRVRSILIKVGALAGAGVAVGVAMALSRGTPSTPPGSR
jgi:hypothetical protein